MEDDDEFGDLYTDVLRPFSSTSTTKSLSSLPPQPYQPSPTPTQLLRPIDLNLQSQHDGNTLFGAPAAQTLAPFKPPPSTPAVPAAAAAPDSIPSSLGSAPEPMVLDSRHESADGKELEFDIEEGGGNGIEDIGSNDPFIPGLTEAYVRPGATPMPGATAGGSGGAPGQVSPIMGAMAGRGRGDWRPSGMKAGPPMEKGFHPSFGAPGWGNNTAGRGFGGGLEFTLPSHKIIFDVDIDSFEEKPWKYPGVDLSDFFNFGLNEESWKDYCKQLEQHRLETTMQSKIRVYESGRTEQGYDPDLPPELAAATAQVVPAAANLIKSDGGQNDMTKGAGRVRPPLPTGRPIQVEGGSGERLPSIDTRPPRVRDSDAVIEIVCQDTLDDDSSTGNGVDGRAENDLPMEDLRGDLASEAAIAHEDTEYFDDSPDACKSRKKELVERTMNFVHDNVREDNGVLPFPVEASRPYGAGPRVQSPMGPSENSGSPDGHRQGRVCKKSPCITPIHGERDNFNDTDREESVERMDGKSPRVVRDPRESSVEHKDHVDDELEPADGSPVTEKDELINDTHKDQNSLNPMRNEKTSSQAEQWKLRERDDDEDSRAARSSENSKARSGSSRDYQKWRDGAEEEVVQGERSSRFGIVKKHLDENDQNFRRKGRDGRLEIERNRMVGKPGEDSYPLRDVDVSLSHNLPVKKEGFGRRRENDNPDDTWQWREDDPYGRKERAEDLRKRDHDNEMRSRNRAKVRESERSDKDDYPSRKQLDNGNYKDVSARHGERDDNLKSRYEAADDYPSKRRKDEEYLRRDHTNKEEILQGRRESSGSRRKRERDEILDPRKRDEQRRTRENFDEHHSARHKDEVWLNREKVERPRERDEWLRLKQSHDGSLSKREREEGRGTVRSGRGLEDKAWGGHTRGKDEYKVSEKEYQLKGTVRHSEQAKRRDRNDDESSSCHRGREDLYVRGHQFSNDERKSRPERSSTRSDHGFDASDSQKGHEKKHKENTRKNRESEGGNQTTLGSAKKSQEDLSGHNNETGLKSDEKSAIHYNSSRKHKEDASSEDELRESKRGRSKLERWTSHTERDYSINSKSSASLKFKETEKINNVVSSESNKFPDGPGKSVEPVEHFPPSSDNKGVGEPEIKEADTRPSEDQHLDTVEKLKKRSERFKLPISREKDTLATKTENEALPLTENETPVDSEIKHERPARKRRWISN
ncbi:hypothetical protein GOBAR_DD27514 [Gossypium barbadense]|nr:hypothetical protein GOBAR_DD27514 [Gossypium barbadense]